MLIYGTEISNKLLSVNKKSARQLINGPRKLC